MNKKILASLMGAAALLVSIAAFTPSTDPEIQGFGKIATGGGTNPQCVVNNPAGTGAGSFSDCARRGNVNVVFSGPGPFLVDGQNTYLKSNTTIDGCANGQNGVTLSQPADIHRAVVLEGPATNLIVRCIRFQGQLKTGNNLDEHDLLGLDGTDGLITKVLVDRSTFTEATDGAIDITGDVTDVTVQRSLLYRTPLNSLIKYGKRARISLHHNVYTGGCERNPQIKGDIDGFDFVSNLIGLPANPPIFDPEAGNSFTDCYGLRLAVGSDSPGSPKGNVTNSAFFGPLPVEFRGDPLSAGSFAGVFLSNIQCAGGCPTSPASVPYPIPAAAAVTATPISGLKVALANVGSPNKTAADQAALDAALNLLPGSTPTPTPTPVPTPTPTPVPTPTPCPTPKPLAVISTTLNPDGSLTIVVK